MLLLVVLVIFFSRRSSRQSLNRSKESVVDDAEAIAKNIKLIQDEKEEEGNVSIFLIYSL